MRITQTTLLAISAAEAFRHVRTPALLEYVAAPMMRFKLLEPKALPTEWEEARYKVGLRLFGVLPIGHQWIVTSVPNGEKPPLILRDNGHSPMIRKWDHWIFIEPLSGSSCRYTDRVDVGAGILTPGVWLFTKLFYAHRQRRWRKLVTLNFAPLEKDQQHD
jgi:hypothetical protein